MPIRRNPSAPYWLAIEKREREIIDGALSHTGGNVTRAAGALGIDRTHLINIMRRLGIDRKSYSAQKAST